MRTVRAFTLIELLIVVAIIAILAAIAVPNFLEAQTRSKVSRCRADLRSIVTALEAYRIDFNAYPYHRGPGEAGFGEMEPVHVNNGYGAPRANAFRTIPLRLSTPVAYITTVALRDPFKRGATDPAGAPNNRYESGDPTDEAFAYHNIYQYAIQQMTATFYEDDFNRDYGYWRIFSIGPNMTYETTARTGTFFGQPDLGWLYDPTNGTVSGGYILRTQIDPVGERLAVPNP
ncbi:MAG: prepilin-type N-terminal cleavage/methylation domain-containing protein [Candidatus Sumerlaeia bacterium]|nr:prepilin-type N-terminal cleavage/methylation domain-containing protein [Candidatus Sumerlaeia bacterium]